MPADRLRGLSRTLVYATPLHRVAAWARRRSGVLAAPRTAEFWDGALSGPMKAYLRGTPSIDLRNAVTAVVLRHAASGACSLLDVGCAGGTLAVAARAAGITRYFGVDISQAAVRDADASLGEFRVADFCAFEPPEGAAFDAIVFNEVLYYVDVDEAVRQLERYAALLAPSGVLVFSMKDDPKSRAILARAARGFEWVTGVVFQEQLGRGDWAIRRDARRPGYLVGVLRPRGAVSRG